MAPLISTYRGHQLAQATLSKRSFSSSVTLGKTFDNLSGSIGAVLKPLLGRLALGVGGVFSGGLSFLWGLTVQTFYQVWTFNWTQTDEEIDAQIEGLKNSIGSILGGTLGNALGWLVCGIIPGALITRFNPALGAYVLKEVGEEALDELIGNLSALARFSLQVLLRSFILNTYKGVRKLFFVDTPFNRGLAELLGIDFDEARNNYLSKKSRHWSFASRFEEWVDNIPNAFVRNFVEEFSEEFAEACIEAGFVVTFSVESWMAMQKMGNNSILGPTQSVEIQPDRSTEERIVVTGPQELIKQQIIQVVTDHQVLDKRDVGTIVAMPSEDYLLAKPKTGLRIVVTLTSNKTPPFSNAATRVQIEIPDLNRSALEWERIKFAVGGENGYTWGRFFATAFFESGRRVRVHAITAGEAVDRIKLLVPMIDSTLRTITTGEEAKEGERLLYPSLQKDPVIVYPAFMTIFNRVELLETQRNLGVRNIRTGKRYEMREEQIQLWVPRKPPTWESVIQNLLNRGTNGL
jgi:hypothetical protein